MGLSLCCIKASPPSPNSHPSISVSVGHRHRHTRHQSSFIRSITLDEYMARKKRQESAPRDLLGGRVHKRVIVRTITLDEFTEQLKNHPDAGKRPISPREVLVRYERIIMRSITLDEYLAKKKNSNRPDAAAGKRPITPAEDVSGGHKPQSSLITSSCLTLAKFMPQRKNHHPTAGKSPIRPAADDKHQSSLTTNSSTLDESSKIQAHTSSYVTPSPHVMRSNSADAIGTQELNVDDREGDMSDQCKTQIPPKKKVSFGHPEVTDAFILKHNTVAL